MTPKPCARHQLQPGQIVRWVSGEWSCSDEYGDSPMLVVGPNCVSSSCSRPAAFVTPIGAWKRLNNYPCPLSFWEIRFVVDPFLTAVYRRKHGDAARMANS